MALLRLIGTNGGVLKYFGAGCGVINAIQLCFRDLSIAVTPGT
jgi:hypothetical protein